MMLWAYAITCLNFTSILVSMYVSFVLPSVIIISQHRVPTFILYPIRYHSYICMYYKIPHRMLSGYTMGNSERQTGASTKNLPQVREIRAGQICRYISSGRLWDVWCQRRSHNSSIHLDFSFHLWRRKSTNVLIQIVAKHSSSHKAWRTIWAIIPVKKSMSVKFAKSHLLRHVVWNNIPTHMPVKNFIVNGKIAISKQTLNLIWTNMTLVLTELDGLVSARKYLNGLTCETSMKKHARNAWKKSKKKEGREVKIREKILSNKKKK